MKIIRNGIEIELTYSEMYEAYRQCKRELLIEDLRNKAIEDDVDLDNVDIEKLADRADRAIDNNESMWESYWMSIEYALEDVCESED